MSPVMNARVEKFTHINTCGLPVCHTGSRESLKFGVQGASATNWFSRVNGARDNGIWLYMRSTWGPPGSCRPQMGPFWPLEPCYEGCYKQIWPPSSLYWLHTCTYRLRSLTHTFCRQHFQAYFLDRNISYVKSNFNEVHPQGSNWQWIGTGSGNSLAEKNGCHFTDATFKYISLNENVQILIKISLKFVLRV